MYNFRKWKRSKKLILVCACLLLALIALLDNDSTISQVLQRYLSKREFTTSSETVNHFPHFLKTMKNPCYLQRHESELFKGLTDVNMNADSNVSANAWAVIRLNKNGINVTDNLR